MKSGVIISMSLFQSRYLDVVISMSLFQSRYLGVVISMSLFRYRYLDVVNLVVCAIGLLVVLFGCVCDQSVGLIHFFSRQLFHSDQSVGLMHRTILSTSSPVTIVIMGTIIVQRRVLCSRIRHWSSHAISSADASRLVDGCPLCV